MRRPLVDRRRWAHWTFGLGAAAIAVGLGAAILQSVPGHRVLTPPYLLGLYWLLAIALNYRTLHLGPDGLTIHIGPFPIRRPQHFPPGELRCCYARHVVMVDGDGVEGQTFYTVGVETTSGLQFPLPIQFNSAAPALAAAELFGKRANIPGELRQPSLPPPANWRPILLWAAAFLLAIAAGAVWHITQ